MKKIRITTQSGELVKEFENVTIEDDNFTSRDHNGKIIAYLLFDDITNLNLTWKEIVVKEKKPVVRWQWIYCSGSKYGRTEGYYSEDEAKNFIGNVFGKKLIRKIENSAEEFPE